MSRMEKLVHSIKHANDEKLTDLIFEKCKLESKMDLLGIRYLATEFLNQMDFEEVEELLEEPAFIQTIIVEMLPKVLSKIGEIAESVELSEENKKDLIDRLASIK